MTAQQLKNAILQLAITGKLVPQDPNDEPASVLLDKIRKEKERLVKEGKIKPEKKAKRGVKPAGDLLSYAQNEDEFEPPFEIPENWEWTKLGNILLDSFSGKSPKYVKFSTQYRIIGQAANQPSGIDYNCIKYTDEAFWGNNEDRYFLRKDDVILNTLGNGTLGRSGIIKDLRFPLLTDGHLFVFRSSDQKTNYYLYYYLLFIKEEIVKRANGSTNQTFLNLSSTLNWLIPLPPLAEQRRIVAALEKLLPLVEEYGEKEEALKTLDANFPAKLKKSILQEAVQGKLVPQDPNDEPADLLLARIRDEKEKLVKEGKIKRDKKLSTIVRRGNSYYEKFQGKEVCIDDELPFEIPVNWEWARLRTVCTKLIDGDHNPPKGTSCRTDYIMASSTNINNDSLENLETVRYLTKETFIKENERTSASPGDIFFTSVGSIGRSCIYWGGFNICFQRSVSVISTLLFNEYLKGVFDSVFFQEKVRNEATGTAQKGFYLNQLANSLIPIPPLAEQRRIVAKIEKLFAVLATPQ